VPVLAENAPALRQNLNIEETQSSKPQRYGVLAELSSVKSAA
jgi:hypothetical protein